MPYLTLPARSDCGPVSIHYRVRGPADASRTLLCVHELGGRLESFEALCEDLPPDLRVVTFDQRGAGRSEHMVAPFAVETLARDIEALLDELDVRAPVHLLGMAMGAVVALKAAMLLDRRLASLMLFDGTAEISEEARDYILKRAATVRENGMRPIADVSLANAFRGIDTRWDEPRWADHRHRFLTHAPLSYALFSEALAAVKFEDSELARVSCPTLVVTGTHDFIWPPEVGRSMAMRLPNAQFREMAGSSHFPPLQSPDRVAATVAAFVDTHAA
jgi:3-oxoadipate enol-lactonase